MKEPVSKPRFLRQFALTQGRAKSVLANLPLDTLVKSTALGDRSAYRLAAEQARILDLCRSPQSIAEIAAHLEVHLGIARVLVGDLVGDKLVAISTNDFDDNGPDLATLERLLDDLQAL